MVVRTWQRWVAAAGLVALLAPPTFVLVGTCRLSAPWEPAPPADLPAEPLALTVDGYRLDGWWIPVEGSRGVVVVLHGHAKNKAQMVDRMVFARELGWSVLAVSVRGHGASDGWRSDIGVTNVADAAAALAEARRRAGGRPVVGWGLSMGAGLLLQQGADAELDGIIVECPYRDLGRATEIRLAWALPDVVAPPLARVAGWWSVQLLGVDPAAVSPVRAAFDLPPGLPVLVLMGGKDWKAPAGDVMALEGRPGTRIEVLRDASHEEIFAAPEAEALVAAALAGVERAAAYPGGR